jgi:hypothetical protein
MDAATPLAIGDDNPGPIPNDPQRTELLLDALKAAIAAPGEHRLFRSGRLAGLFASKVGIGAEAALLALREGLLETIRTETKGKIVIEWVRATPRAVAFLHENDSPKSVLREMKEVLASAKTGIPVWMTEAKREAASLSARFEEKAALMLNRLDDLAQRVEAALRRAEATGPSVAAGASRIVPWAVEAVEYLDQRRGLGLPGDCPLPELFQAIRLRHPDLTLPTFQNGLRRLNDLRAIRLCSGSELSEPEFAMVVGGQMMNAVSR